MEVSVEKEKIEDIRIREINEKITNIINNYWVFGHYFSRVRPISTYKYRYSNEELPLIYSKP